MKQGIRKGFHEWTLAVLRYCLTFLLETVLDVVPREVEKTARASLRLEINYPVPWLITEKISPA